MFIKIIAKCIRPFLHVLDILSPVGDLIVRLYVANIFFMSGLTKIQSWQSTINLFQYEYSVPLLSAQWAAITGTAAELILPVLLVLGLGGRLAILLFFAYNALTVAFYPYLWTQDGAMGLSQHITWGLLLMMLMFHGPGKISLDYWLNKLYGHHLRRN